ncbi:MAG: M28 family peptidase [Roseivirga sp.]
MKQVVLVLLMCLFVIACSDSKGSSEKKSTNAKPLVEAPAFDADKAYAFVQKQVDFGPRVPNSKAHKETSVWLKEQFESFGAKVYMQEFESAAYDGTELDLVNIIASFNPGVKKRILLAAHWDTRPFADQDENDKRAPLDGANDGGSGVGVLLEVARVIGANEGPNVGVDIILFDGEDWGEHAADGRVAVPAGQETWFCLGSQYWSKNKHIPNYSAFYGILLDMVGAKNATFYYDGESQKSAARVMTKVWERGIALGHDEYFIPKLGMTGITDDHVYVNKHARIPMIDIIDYRPGGGFTPVWHTQQDNMENIDKNTLKVVGEVVLSMLYNE